MERLTIVKILQDTRPRTDMLRRVGISAQYASDIARGQPIGGTETLARFAGRELLPKRGRAAAGEILLATLESQHPEHFADTDASEAA